MERFIIFVTRVMLKFLRVDANYFLTTFGKELNVDFLPLAYSQRGILKYIGDDSGEKYLLHEVLARDFPADSIIIDIGANVGDFTEEIHEAFPLATVFSFEPNPVIADELEKRVGSFASVVKSAVGDRTGTIQLFNSTISSKSAHGSIYSDALTQLHGYRDVAHIDVPVTTLELFCQMHKIDRVDFLKIDTEGHEYAVLLGSLSLIKGGRITAIQFEFNEMNVVSRVFLKDFFSLLPEFDFYRLDTNSLHRLQYSPREEIFQFQNILAVQKGKEIANSLRNRFGK